MAKKIVTIERHILEKQKQYPQATGTLTGLLYDMALAAKLIARETDRAGLLDIFGEVGTLNSSGEAQQKLDVFADQTIFQMNDHTGRLCAMASEERESIIDIPTHFDSGKYVLLYDPLDGSSNIDSNVSIGTIFAIHRKISPGVRGTIEDLLQPGRSLVAAGYVVYSVSTMMVYSTGQGVHGFTLDPTLGEFLLSHEDIRIPATPHYYSANLGNARHWTPGVRRYADWLCAVGDETNEQPLSLRYIGSMVADFHRNLLHGGVFFYPGDLQTPDKPYGKLRLLFEAQAMAFLAEQAGGYGSDGVGNILDIQPTTLHQRVPLFVGDRALVERAEGFIQRHDSEWIEAYGGFRKVAAIE
ncbi:MAG: class 1 fructose-bisphosphatase [Chloroflexota bacterium]|nr:class 1 fructose-bisphosphatase [Chloroflexota bacterium]